MPHLQGSEGCEPALHCVWCNVDEPDNPCYRACGECLHVFATAEDLLREHNTMLRDISLHVFCTPDPDGWMTVERGRFEREIPVEADPDRVWACPLCSHDF